ncbi:ERF family protein [Caldalkalibacillus thermarum TA2.A1]|uniref:ERF family protein n=1 Tax=Caldalkalibacillus thermarum (strain TA2.A1) TaxID=986075 RepID=A0A8X8IA89_CALTT|nr:ERF family protein [Caldalkalibacillus thermarum]QZT33680.1 ERF family protein [Caldalkalibacillus thermarum TA2.A1]
MKRSEQFAELGKALAAFQAEVANPKNTAINEFANGHRYAPLGEILATVRPILGKHGLAVVQDAKIEGNTVVVTTTLFHESGEWLESEPLVLPAAGKGGVTAQTIGAAITYGRRYQLSTLLGISSEDDDDANSISVTDPSKPPQSPSQSQKQPKQSTQKQKTQKEPNQEPNQQAKQQTETQTKQQKQQESEQKTNGRFKMVGYKDGRTESGTDYALVKAVNIETGETVSVFGRGKAGIELSLLIPQNEPFSMEYKEENGFNFLTSINGKTIADVEKELAEGGEE